ncbi:hypothetical protein EJ05DRAFT_173417 [Pseudovirgaria hyperparasitica]|uniref:Uncharacterized protein n=1 Tax=Pseudovirgaria hyperparasitica TaxID=470096 RepID=A0A6A6VX66_9PEZI|nr:uncharacterized protein EJ05DRAFT_173417 [Pseudovirgaria hyperparasitica]KAF2753831.1 hypothetical protein EJ05DRAFT_173417 [Pseudovirgaria hyperparasitica]
MAEKRYPRIVLQYHPEHIPLLWFVRNDADDRKDFEHELNAIVESLTTDDPGLAKKTIHGVPWIRNYEPTVADVKSMVLNLEPDTGDWFLVATSDFRETKRLYVVHPAQNSDRYGCVSAAFDAAVAVLLKKEPWKSTLDQLFSSYSYSVVDVGSRPSLTHDTPDVVGPLPAHIPSDIRLDEKVITLFSLVKLTDDEIVKLRALMNDANHEIVIYNWPHDTPASHTETYNIFQHVKPPMISPCGETFVLFIDTEFIEGPKREPIVFYIKQQISNDNDFDRIYDLQLITGCFRGAQHVRETWHMIWNPPPKRGSVNGVEVNWAFDRAPYREWSRAEASYPYTSIAPPSVPIYGGRSGAEFLVFIICPVTALELRALKSLLRIEGSAGQFIELALENDSMESLLAYFDSPAFRKYSKPPNYFGAIDKHALKSLMTWWPRVRDAPWDERMSLGSDEHDGEDPPYLLFADDIKYWHRVENGHLIARETPGYNFARLDLSDEDNLRDVEANLSTANMWFAEMSWTFLDGDDIATVFWPEFKGLSREDLEAGG